MRYFTGCNIHLSYPQYMNHFPAPAPHLLKDIWEKNPSFSKSPALTCQPHIEKILADFFSIGPYYYYALECVEGKISCHHQNMLRMHGLKRFPNFVHEVIDLVHPEDLPFVIAAEEMCYNKIHEIGSEHFLHLKSSYCFRMKTAENKYEMFHHQAIHTHLDDDGNIFQAINIHTNIEHLGTSNSYTALVSGIGGRQDVHYLKIHTPEALNDSNALTHREQKILMLIAKGYNSRKIAGELCISEHTVRTHRKNILQKTGCSISTALVKNALDKGFL